LELEAVTDNASLIHDLTLKSFVRNPEKSIDFPEVVDVVVNSDSSLPKVASAVKEDSWGVVDVVIYILLN
jgi:hypothetical protein